ncbi:MAG: hypothetical protein HHJ11_05530 [Phycicoccus sp.]|nr:hypothetical protein [Phycicoccus sp.]
MALAGAGASEQDDGFACLQVVDLHDESLIVEHEQQVIDGLTAWVERARWRSASTTVPSQTAAHAWPIGAACRLPRSGRSASSLAV